MRISISIPKSPLATEFSFKIPSALQQSRYSAFTFQFAIEFRVRTRFGEGNAVGVLQWSLLQVYLLKSTITFELTSSYQTLVAH